MFLSPSTIVSLGLRVSNLAHLLLVQGREKPCRLYIHLTVRTAIEGDRFEVEKGQHLLLSIKKGIAYRTSLRIERACRNVSRAL